jgi:hypothetical protein
MQGVRRITPLLEYVEGGVERIIEALRWSGDSTAVARVGNANRLGEE